MAPPATHAADSKRVAELAGAVGALGLIAVAVLEAVGAGDTPSP